MAPQGLLWGRQNRAAEGGAWIGKQRAPAPARQTHPPSLVGSYQAAPPLWLQPWLLGPSFLLSRWPRAERLQLWLVPHLAFLHLGSSVLCVSNACIPSLLSEMPRWSPSSRLAPSETPVVLSFTEWPQCYHETLVDG